MKTFGKGYDHHSLRTEANKSPLQLWICGAITYQPHSDWEVEDVPAYGIDWDEPVNLTHNENLSLISVPDITNPLDDEMFPLFSACLHPLKESDICGVDIYVLITIIRDFVVY